MAGKRTRKPSRQTLMVLAVMARQPAEWQHGYDISGETGLQSGTLYPILMRLSKRGLLDSKWEPSKRPGRPPRHMYRLTAAGVEFANTVLDDETARDLDGLLGSHA